MNDLKIVSVVLNYKTFNDAIECVNLLLSQTYENTEIVIVENGSQNNSYEALLDEFKSNEKVTIIESKENLGFAKGNNLGIIYAREKLNADYVFVVNSDILVEKTLFEEIVQYQIDNIGAISPTVYNINGEYQMPAINTNSVGKDIYRILKGYIFNYLLYLPIINKKYKKYTQQKPKSSYMLPKTYDKFVLQGCSYFLTPYFFKYYNKLYPKTFLYWEEVNLMMYLEKVGLTSILVKTSKVIHKEGQATNKLITKDKTKTVLRYSCKSMFKSIPMFFMSYEQIKKKYN